MKKTTAAMSMIIACVGLVVTIDAQQRPTSVNLRNAFGLLQSLATLDPGLSKDDWEEALGKEGLRRDADGNMWRLRNADGELRAQRSIRGDGAVYFLLFFPATTAPIPQPMLDWMLRESRYVRLDDGDKFLIGLPTRPLEVSGQRGELQTEVTVYLAGGTLSRTVVTISWSR